MFIWKSWLFNDTSQHSPWPFNVSSLPAWVRSSTKPYCTRLIWPMNCQIILSSRGTSVVEEEICRAIYSYIFPLGFEAIGAVLDGISSRGEKSSLNELCLTQYRRN